MTEAAMSKADRIRALYKTGRYTTREIAEIVGCGDSYVRVAARQRVDGKASRSDVMWRQYCKHGDREAAGVVRRRVYRNLRDQGLDVVTARRRASSVAFRTMCKSGRAVALQTSARPQPE